MSREVPELSHKQQIEFLNLVAQMASSTTIERRLGISRVEQEVYKKRFDIECQDDARKAWRKLSDQRQESQERFRTEEVQKARDAEQIAQERLEQMNQDKAQEKPLIKIDAAAIKQEDAERQRRFAKQQGEMSIPAEEWHLPLEGSKETRAATVDQFRKDIVYRGFHFCKTKYSANKGQIQFEAHRLGLSINWDLVKR